MSITIGNKNVSLTTTELNLNNTKLKSLPESIGKLTNLTELQLNYTNLISLPESIGNLTNLKYLNLRNTNKITYLPKSIGNLTNLQNLNLSNTNLISLSESIGNLTNLTELQLNYTKLTSLPESIGKLTNLNYLYLVNTNLTSLPESIGKLSKLLSLNLRNTNKITDLPESIGNLTNLTDLQLNYTELKSLPESIGNLTNLNYLYLVNTNLTSLPESIANLTNLKVLYLNNTKLKSLPESIGNLTNLTELKLNYTELKSLPESIGKLTNLKYLNLDNTKLTSLPESFGKLSKLLSLNLNNNQLTSLPESIGNLTNLTNLYLSNTNIKSLPESIGNLTNLKYLDLINTKIIDLPESIGNLTNLIINGSGKLKKIFYYFRSINNIKNIIKFIILLDKKQIQEDISDKLNYTYKSYCNLIKKIQFLSKNELRNKVIEFVEKNPNSPLSKFENKKYTESDINIYFDKYYNENDFNLYTSSKITYNDVFEHFTDMIYTIYDFKKENKECKDCTKDDIDFFIQQKFNKDKLCRYMTQLEDIYIKYMKEKVNCTNKDFLISGYEIEEVPYGQLVIYKDKTDNTEYCFTVDELEKLKGTKLNPYNNQPIPDEIFEEINERKKYKDWLVKSEVDESVLLELAKYDISYMENKIYSDLYNYMTNVENIYPIDREDYKKKDINELKNKFRQYIDQEITERILSQDEINNVINSPPEQFHIKLANAILKIVEKEDSNQKSRIVLLKQIGIF